MGKRFLLISTIILGLWGIFRMLYIRDEIGDNYPEYSTYRSDPKGTSLLFEMLRDLNPESAKQNLYNLALGDLDPDRDSIVIPGYLFGELEESDTYYFRHPESDKVSDFVEEGGELILSFSRRNYFFHKEDEEESKDSSQKEEIKTKQKEPRRENQMLAGLWLEKRDDSKKADPPANHIRQKKNHPFVIHANENWVVEAVDNLSNPYLLHRNFGKGKIKIIAESYYLSNEAILKKVSLPVINWAFPKENRYVFDDSAMTFTKRNQGIMYLLRSLGLGSVMILWILFVGLIAWKNLQPLVQYQNSEQELAEERSDRNDLALESLFLKHLSPQQALELAQEEASKSKRKNFSSLQARSKDPWLTYNQYVEHLKN